MTSEVLIIFKYKTYFGKKKPYVLSIYNDPNRKNTVLMFSYINKYGITMISCCPWESNL